jgi:hypothetical protein
VIAAAMIAIGVSMRFALANGADGGTAPEGLQALNVLDSHVVYALVASFGVMMLGAAGWFLGAKGSTVGWDGPRSRSASRSSFRFSGSWHCCSRRSGSSSRALLSLPR